MGSRLTLVALALAASACGSADPISPSTLKKPRLVSIGNGGTAASVAIRGSTYKLRANAHFTGGYLPLVDVTSEATWTSSRPDIAKVSETGRLIAVERGETEIAAEYRGVVGRTRIIVQRPYSASPYEDEVMGTVSEASSLGIHPASRVEISGGAHDGRVIPYVSGVFRFDNIAAPGFDLIVSSRGYQTTRVPVTQVPANLDIALHLEDGMISEEFAGNACDQNPQIRRFRPSRDGPFLWHRLTAFVTGIDVGLRYDGAFTRWESLVGGREHELLIAAGPEPLPCSQQRDSLNFRILYSRPR